jgi:hypothetical protein
VILLALLLWQADHNEIIRTAAAAAEDYSKRLPDFICEQVTDRYLSRTLRPEWKRQDRVEVEVLYTHGGELYRNLRINGKPAEDGNADPGRGTWSKGEYGTVLTNLFRPESKTLFMPRRHGVYDFAILQAHSHWRLSVGEASVLTAYSGTVRIDPASGQTLNIEMTAHGIPRDFPWDMAEVHLTYDWVKIDARKYLLPVRSENICCVRDTWHCTRNVISFRNHRKFDAASRITFH